MAESILKLKVASEEYENKLKRASEGLQKYIEGCRKAGGTLEHLDDGVLDFVKALGSMETKSTSARGKISELRKGFIDMKAEYLHMTEAEKNGDIGKALSASLDQMKIRFHVAKNELAEINKELSGNKFGEFGNVLDTLGSKLGVTGNLTEMLTSKTALLTGAVGAGIAIVTKATEAWAGYNAELAKQDQITTVTTGLKGDDADRMTDKIRALSDTYNVDFREAVNAANTLMTQFGKTGDEATQLIKDGMQGMIQGDGPKLLSMIQQYAPAFRDAGVSASQLVAVIQNSEGGIFTDQNMNAIVMGIKNIRLMTDATSQALAKMGIDGEKMSQQLSNGTLTIFDALKQVSHQLQTVDSNSKTAGEVMQNVFGRQGVTAGTNLAKAIETLNTDLEQTKVQTGEVGNAMAELQQANEDLNQAIRDAFSYDGWDQMANGIKAKLITALATVIEQLGKIRNFFDSFSPGNVTNTSEVEKQLKKLRSAKTSGSTYYTNFAYNDQVEKYNRNINGLDAYIKQYDQNHSSVNTVIQKASKEYGQKFSSIEDLRDLRNAYSQSLEDYKKGALSILSEPTKTTNTSNTNHHRTGGNTTTTKTEDTNYAADSIMAQEKLVAKLTDQYKRAGAAVKDGIKKQLDEAKKTLDEMNGKVEKIDLEKMFPDYSKQNYNTGYAGSTKAKIDSARQDFALSTTNFDTINSYISGIKNALKDADLGSDLYNSLTEQLKDATTMSTMLQELMERGLQGADLQSVAEKFKTALLEGDVPDDKIKEYIDKLNEQIKNAGGIELLYNEKTGEVKDKDKKKSDRDVLKDSKQLAGGLSQVASGLKAVGVELPKEVDQVLGVINGVSQIISGVGTIISIFGTTAITSNTTAVGLNTAAITGLITALEFNSATNFFGFAGGGIVPHAANGYFVGGTHMSGDVTPIMANAGELVLSKSQQGVLASMLTDGDRGGVGGSSSLPYVDGETIYLGLKNYLMRSGRGEIVTTRR